MISYPTPELPIGALVKFAGYKEGETHWQEITYIDFVIDEKGVHFRYGLDGGWDSLEREDVLATRIDLEECVYMREFPQPKYGLGDTLEFSRDGSFGASRVTSISVEVDRTGKSQIDYYFSHVDGGAEESEITRVLARALPPGVVELPVGIDVKRGDMVVTVPSDKLRLMQEVIKAAEDLAKAINEHGFNESEILGPSQILDLAIERNNKK